MMCYYVILFYSILQIILSYYLIVSYFILFYFKIQCNIL